MNGAAIETVRPGSAADDAGLAPGDVILEVNRHPVEDAENFVSQFTRCRRQRRFAAGLVQRRLELPRCASGNKQRKQ